MASRRVRPVITTVGVLLVLLVVVVATVTGLSARAARGALYATGLYVDGGAPTVDPTIFAGRPTPTPISPAPVLETGADPAGSVPGIDPAAVARRVAAVDRRDVGDVGAMVLDPASGQTLYAAGPDRPQIPASTMKLLTSTAALAALGPQHQFSTTVVTGDPVASPASIILVGGGDPYLMSAPDKAFPDRADLPGLARSTAQQLKERDLTTVSLGYDASLFTGPGWNPTWPQRYGDEITTVSALWVDEGRTEGRTPSVRDTDPPRQAATEFAAALSAEGITVNGIGAARAADGADQLAAAVSEPLDLIVESVLRHSDNDAAEVLLRHIALAAGRPGSTTEGAAALRDRLTDLGVDLTGAALVDGSGLSRDNRITPAQLAHVLGLALGEQHPELRSVLTGLPVAAADGSLRSRYFSSGTTAGRGEVRAKTGTLSGVHALAGYTRTADGAVVVLAFVINGGDDFADRVHLDRVTAAVTACGC